MVIYQRISGMAFMALAAAVFVAARQYPPGAMGDPGPQLFPMTIAALMFPLGLLLALKKPPQAGANKPVPFDPGRLLLALLLLLVTIGFVLVMEHLGTMVGIALYLFCSALILGPRSVKAVLAYAAMTLAVSGVLYLIFFRVFELALPAGILF